jgi:hypothetical protein
MGSYLASIEFGKPSGRFNSFRFSWHDKARDAIVDDFEHRAGPEGNDGRAAGHRLDHDEAEWFWPIDWKEQRSRSRQKLPFLFIVDLADELDLCPVDLRFKLFLEIFPFAPRHFCCDTKRHFGGMRNPNGGLRSFLMQTNAGISSYVPIQEKLTIEPLQGLNCRRLPAWPDCNFSRGWALCSPPPRGRNKGFEPSERIADVHRLQKPPEQAAATVRLGTEPS